MVGISFYDLTLLDMQKVKSYIKYYISAQNFITIQHLQNDRSIILKDILSLSMDSYPFISDSSWPILQKPLLQWKGGFILDLRQEFLKIQIIVMPESPLEHDNGSLYKCKHTLLSLTMEDSRTRQR